MKKQGRVVGINLGKKDEDIKSWIIALKAKNLEYSFFIKQIMLGFLNKESIFLGKVHLHNHSQNMRISVYISDDKTLSLLNSLENKNIKVSSFMKSLIRKNIKIIPRYQDEILPDYIDFLGDISDISIGDTSINIEKPPRINEPKPLTTKNKKLSSLAVNYTSFGD